MKKKFNKLNGMNKKLMIYIIAAVIIVICGIVVLMILKATIFNRISVDRLDDKMVYAARKYFDNNKDKLPINDKDIATLSISELVNGGYLKSLDKLLKDQSLTCSGEVTVTNNGGYYLYSPKVNCGDKYKTQKLYEVITSPENLVTEKDGLYKVGNDYIYRGEKVNNYVSFNDSLWRILRVNGSDNSIRMIKIGDLQDDTYVWDDRYNSEKGEYSGINNFNISRLKDTILEQWQGEDVIKNINKMYVSTQPLCSGKRNIDSTDKTNTPDCSSNDGNYSLTLPLPSDYFVVSIDNKCKRIYDSECTNYNYFMKFESNTWSTVIDGKTSYKAYKFEPTPYLAKTDSESHLRFVINISGEVNFINGDGTKDNPYIFE